MRTISKDLLFAGALSSLLIVAGCAPAPAPSNSNANAPKPAASPSPATTAKKETKLPAAKAAPVPTDWIKLADEVKGYEFQVPAGTKGDGQTTPSGVDAYAAEVPAPYDVHILVFAFKDKTKTKDDLIAGAKAALESMGEKDVTIDGLTEITDDYSIANFSSTDDKGVKTKGKVLVATDVTDNYIMMVATDETKFAGNEKTIDAIWGSFTMYSGGSTGNS
jgi:hypothetical protein